MATNNDVTTIETEDATIRIWATATELPDSEMERKKYYVIVEDGKKSHLKIIIVRGPGAAISVEPYLEHEYDYDDFDEDEEEEEEYEEFYGDTEGDEESQILTPSGLMVEAVCYEGECQETATIACPSPGCLMVACAAHPLTCILCQDKPHVEGK